MGGGKSLVINVLLNSQVQELTDVVIVGYTTSTKKSLVSAVSSVKTEELKEIPVTNITQGLAGRLIISTLVLLYYASPLQCVLYFPLWLATGGSSFSMALVGL